MTHQEMRPEKWDELITAKSKRDQNKFVISFTGCLTKNLKIFQALTADKSRVLDKSRVSKKKTY
jgi:hypothetical protein